MNAQPPDRPPEIVAASERGIDLAGAPVSLSAVVPQQTESRLRDAVADTSESQRIYVNVEDITAAGNPGVVYGVYLNRPPDASSADHYHIGNIVLFGIEKMNDADTSHVGVSGFRHSFDITDLVNDLRSQGQWDDQQVTLTFEPLVPLPPPGQEDSVADSVTEQRVRGEQEPVHIGRVSVFVT